MQPLEPSGAQTRPQTDLADLAVGERVSYRAAGEAGRQAIERAEACGDKLTPAYRRVLDQIVCKTALYSKLADYVSLEQITPPGLDERTTRRACKKLAEYKIIFHRPGNGRGNLTIVGIPPAEKGDSKRVLLRALKAGQPECPPSLEKGGQSRAEKVDTHAYAHAHAILTEVREEDREEIVDDAREDLDSMIETVLRPLTGGGIPSMSTKQRKILEDGLRSNPHAVAVCVQQARGGRNPMGLFFTSLEDAQRNDWRAPARVRSGKRGLSAAEISSHALDLEEEEREMRERLLGWARAEGWRIVDPADRRVVMEDSFRGLDVADYDEAERIAAGVLGDAA